MALYIVTGSPGGGKSYMAAELAMQAFREGAYVHTFKTGIKSEKVDLYGWSEKWVELPEDPLLWERELYRGTEGLPNLMVVDEAGFEFHVHKTTENRRRLEKIYELMVLNRKLGLDVYFLIQDIDNLEVTIRRCAQMRINCIAVEKKPLIGWFMCKFWKFQRVRTTIKGRRIAPNSYHRFNPEVGDFYKTDDLVGRSLALKEGGATRVKMSNPDKWKSILIGGSVLAFAVTTIAICVWRFKDWGKKHDDLAPPPVTAPAAAPVSGVVGTVAGAVVSATGLGPGRGQAGAIGPDRGARWVEGKRYHWAGDRWVESAGPGFGWQSIEWEAADERIICAVQSTGRGLRVTCEGHEVFAVGEVVEGEEIAKLTAYGGRYFAETATGRVFMLRPLTGQERRAKWSIGNSSGRLGSVPGQPALPLASSIMP